jgi:type VI secretion system protein ImpJ
MNGNRATFEQVAGRVFHRFGLELMKLLSRVVWSEGMYLAPHHFQAQSRYFDDSIAFLTRSLWPHAWGFLHLELDLRAVKNGDVSVLHASGIFGDGLAFEMPASDTPPPIRKIDSLFPSDAPEVMLCLAVPARRNDGYDLHPENTAAGARYFSSAQTLRDETNGIDEKEVSLAGKNIRILTQSELTSAMTSVPLARIVRDGRGGFAYDEDFIPPGLRLSASDALMRMLRQILELAGEKSATITRGAGRPNRFEPGVAPLDVANYWFLHSLHSALPPLRHLLQIRHAHPAECFLELSRLAGALCTFAVDSDPRQLPEYNHGNPGPAFRELCAHIRRHLEIVVPSNTVSLQFSPAGRYLYQAPVTDERCLRRARWILGVRSSIGESELLRLVPRLVKVCSAQFVPELVKRALPGMALTHQPVPPAAVRAEVDMQYFSVDTSGACWEHILQTKYAGLYVPGEIADPEFSLTVIVEAAP